MFTMLIIEVLAKTSKPIYLNLYAILTLISDLAPPISRKSRYGNAKSFHKQVLKWIRSWMKLVFVSSPTSTSPVKLFWAKLFQTACAPWGGLLANTVHTSDPSWAHIHRNAPSNSSRSWLVQKRSESMWKTWESRQRPLYCWRRHLSSVCPDRVFDPMLTDRSMQSISLSKRTYGHMQLGHDA